MEKRLRLSWDHKDQYSLYLMGYLRLILWNLLWGFTRQTLSFAFFLACYHSNPITKKFFNHTVSPPFIVSLFQRSLHFQFHASYSDINPLPPGICMHYSTEMALAKITKEHRNTKSNGYFSGFFSFLKQKKKNQYERRTGKKKIGINYKARP